MRRTISFSYSTEKQARDYYLFFNELMKNELFVKLTEDELSHQIFSVPELRRLVELPRGPSGTNPDFTFDNLGHDLVELLTRIVTYKKISFLHYNSKTQVTLVISHENNFPAIGVDLWRIGIAALPAGFVTLEGDDKDLIVSLSGLILNFKEN